MKGVRKLAWAVKSPGAIGSVVHLAFDKHESPEEAIRAYEAATGIGWAEAEARGAILIQQEIVQFVQPDR